MADAIFRNPRFDALRNALYHTARRNFLDGVNRALNFLVIVLGASVVGKSAASIHIVDGFLELSVVFAATGQLVFDLGSRARDHEFLQRKYYDILSEMEKVSDATVSEERAWSAKLLLIAGEESLTMRALDAISYNNALDATYESPEDRKLYRQKIGFWHAQLCQFISFHSTQFY